MTDQFQSARQKDMRFLKSIPDYHHLWDIAETDCVETTCSKGDGKLGFQFTPNHYEKINGWRPYCLCQGRIAKYVYPGIYHFEDSFHLRENN